MVMKHGKQEKLGEGYMGNVCIISGKFVGEPQ